MNVAVAVSLIVAYLLGSVLPAELLARARGVDIRSVGSGNPGTTNAFQVLGPAAGALTGAYDMSKGLMAMWLSSLLGAGVPWIYIAGIVAVLGHRYPAWYRFRGGHGTATATGLLIWCLSVSLRLGWVTPAEMTAIVAAGAATWAVTRGGTVVGIVVLPLVVAAIGFGSTDVAFVAFATLVTGFVWLIQIRVASHGGEPRLRRWAQHRLRRVH